MRSDTVFGNVVHLVSTNLYLERKAVRRQNSGVQGLIQIALRYGDVVLKSTRKRTPFGVYSAKHGVTILDIVHDNTQSYEIVDLIKGLALLQFAINAIEVLWSAVDVALTSLSRSIFFWATFSAIK